MRRFLKIVIAAFVALAWTWTGFLKEKELVTEPQRVGVLITVAILYLGQQLFEEYVQPADRSEVEKRRAVIESYLSALLHAYYELLQRQHLKDLPPIRVNLALPTRWLFGLWRMKIYYQVADGLNAAYSPDELAMKFSKGEGAIGTAWKEKDATYYDSSAGPSSTTGRVAKNKRALVVAVRSVLSIPVLQNGKVTGIVSLDSEFPIVTTRFNQSDVIRVALAHALALAPFSFSGGVR